MREMAKSVSASICYIVSGTITPCLRAPTVTRNELGAMSEKSISSLKFLRNDAVG